MRPTIFYILLLVLFSCGQHAENTTGQINTGHPVDSASSAKEQDSTEERPVYAERGGLDTRLYTISVKAKFIIPAKLKQDSSYYFSENDVIVVNKSTGAHDTLKLSTTNSFGDGVTIKDVAESLEMGTSLMLSITWPGDSDWYTTMFIGYKNNTLKEFFAIDNFNRDVVLERKDKWTLSGFVTNRDELINAFEEDYPVTVSLKDYKVHLENPAKQYVGYLTSALAAIRGYTVSPQNDTTNFTIKKGTALMVDTLYRREKYVSLVVADSIVVRVKLQQAVDKLEKSSAG